MSRVNYNVVLLIGPFRIAYQSQAVTIMSSMVEPVQLICIASYHDNTIYNCEMVGKKQTFPSSPVVHVLRPGIFQCKVTNLVKGQAMSQMMEVQLESGLFIKIKKICYTICYLIIGY